MQLSTTVVLVSIAVLYCVTGCGTSPPTFVTAEVTRMTPPHRGKPIATIYDQQTLTTLAGLLSPGVGRGRRFDGGVAGIVTHQVRFTRDDGRVDVVDIYNGGIAWSEGRGDWLLDEATRERFQRIVKSAQSKESKNRAAHE